MPHPLLTLVLLFAVSSEDLHQFNGHLQQAMATDVLFELTAIVSADESWYKLIPILGLLFLFQPFYSFRKSVNVGDNLLHFPLVLTGSQFYSIHLLYTSRKTFGRGGGVVPQSDKSFGSVNDWYVSVFTFSGCCLKYIQFVIPIMSVVKV